MMIFGVISFLVSLLSISFARLPGLWAGPHAQKPLLSTTLPPSRNYSVGFSLASSYGAAAVIIDDAQEEQRTLTWVVYGNSEYQKVMARLSLESSRHRAPPYDDMQEYFDDQPRVIARRLKKKAGLPASAEVGALATVIQKLRSQIESDLKITVSDATLASPHLVALYQDDVQDICENAGIKYIIPNNLFKPMLWETSSAYAGYGFGLCEHWQNETHCQLEEMEFEDMPVLSVHYSRRALTSTLATIATALGTWDPVDQRIEDFNLGSDAKNSYSSDEEYWRAVKGGIVQRMVENPMLEKPRRIILTGDMVQGEFMQVLKEVIEDCEGQVPPIFSDDAVVVAAKGAAELRRRGQAPWQ